jgi:hypothetical protein
VIVPIYRTDEERSAVLEAAARIERDSVSGSVVSLTRYGSTWTAVRG